MPLIEVTQEDFEEGGLQYVVGVSPCQIDFLTSLLGISDFDDAWANRSTKIADGIPVHHLGKNDLVTAKKLAGRPQDLADLDELRRAE